MADRPFPRWVFVVLWPLVMPVLKLLGPARGRHPERVPKTGGVLILANHRADADPVVLQAFCPRHVYFMAKSELWDMPFVRSWLRYWRAFPVKRGEPDRTALKRAIELLKEGHAVCVFPEGELSETGEMLPLKAGIALIARQAKTPVICCGLTNTQFILPYGKLIPRPAFRSIWVRWGEPWDATGMEPDAIVERATAELTALTGPPPPRAAN